MQSQSTRIHKLAIYLAFLASASACDKKPMDKNDPMAQALAPAEHVDLDIGKIEAVPEEKPVEIAHTWAAAIKEQVRLAEADLQTCRNEYLVPFQFDKMRRRNVEFVNITEMDEVCMDGSPDKKKRGPLKILRNLAQEHTGKNAQLDRFIASGMEQLEFFRVFSFMTKKVGAPEIQLVTDLAKACGDRVRLVGMDVDKSAALIAQWPDGTLPDDDPTVVAKPMDAAAFKAQVVENYGWLVDDYLNAYDRFANKSWEGYDMPKMTALRTWVAISRKRVQQDRARLATVTLDPKQKTDFEGFFTAVEASLKAIEAGYDRYEKTPKDERGPKDPNRKNVETTQKAAQKFLAAWRTPAK